MKRFLMAITVAMSLFALTTAASASDGSYVGLYGGFSMASDADVKTHPVTIPMEFEFDNGIAVGARAGYYLPSDKKVQFGFEADINWQNPDFSAIKAAGVTVPADADTSIVALTGNFLMRFRPSEPLRLYLGLGGGIFKMEVDSGTIAGLPFVGDDDTAMGWQALAGFDYDLGNNLFAFSEVRHQRADFEFGNDISSDVEMRTTQALVGLVMEF